MAPYNEVEQIPRWFERAPIRSSKSGGDVLAELQNDPAFPKLAARQFPTTTVRRKKQAGPLIRSPTDCTAWREAGMIRPLPPVIGQMLLQWSGWFGEAESQPNTANTLKTEPFVR